MTRQLIVLVVFSYSCRGLQFPALRAGTQPGLLNLACRFPIYREGLRSRGPMDKAALSEGANPGSIPGGITNTHGWLNRQRRFAQNEDVRGSNPRPRTNTGYNSMAE